VRTRTWLLLCWGAAAVALLAGSAPAAPSFFGYSGLIKVPTAEALDEGDYNVALFALNFEDGSDSNNWAANLGLKRNLEIGFTRIDPDEGSSETWINGKYVFTPETGANPAVAVGVVDLTDESNTTAYVVLSKAVGREYETKWGEITAPQVHLGAGGGQLEGVFGGASIVLGKRFMLMVEHDSEALNWGARLAITPELRVHFGALDGWDQIGLGISFNKFM
jgi:hypothetical protein